MEHSSGLLHVQAGGECPTSAGSSGALSWPPADRANDALNFVSVGALQQPAARGQSGYDINEYIFSGFVYPSVNVSIGYDIDGNIFDGMSRAGRGTTSRHSIETDGGEQHTMRCQAGAPPIIASWISMVAAFVTVHNVVGWRGGACTHGARAGKSSVA